MDHLIITAGGCGDAILGINAGLLLSKTRPLETTEVLCCVRDEVFAPLKYLFADKIHLYQHPEKEAWGENDGWIIRNQERLKEWPHKIKYCVWPDLLFRANNLSFDEKYAGISIQAIKEYKSLLTDQDIYPEKRIYVATNTSTPEYHYHQTPELLRVLGTTLPDYTIHFNNIKSWAGHLINNGDFNNLPSNVEVYDDNSFLDELLILKNSQYCICVDNGISHIAWNLGIPRTLISKRLDLKGLQWVARWYPQLADGIDYSMAAPDRLANLVKTNIEIPQTLLIPRNVIVAYPGMDWGQALGFKY